MEILGVPCFPFLLEPVVQSHPNFEGKAVIVYEVWNLNRARLLTGT